MNSKTLNRASYITANALRQILVAAFGMAIPLLVVRYADKTIWGIFVPILLFSLLALQFVSWGQKEYLLRQFSMEPHAISTNFSKNVITRLPLVFIAALFAVFWFDASVALWLLFWLLGRFMIQSSEALVIYEKQFKAAVTIEIAAFAFFSSVLIFTSETINVATLLVLYSLYQLFKGFGYAVLFKNHLRLRGLAFEWKYFNKALPFLWLSLLGFLASKADVYIIARFSNAVITSEYQIVNSLLVFVMSVSAYLYAPFTKNIYRSNAQLLSKARQFLLVSGLLIVPLSLVAIYFILKIYLDFIPGFWFYAAAFAYVFPTFVYGIDIVNLFRLKKEQWVVYLLLMGAFFNALLSGGFLYFGYGITGVLAGSACAQILVMILTKISVRFEK